MYLLNFVCYGDINLLWQSPTCLCQLMWKCSLILYFFSGLNYKTADKKKQTLFFSGGNKNTFSLSCCSQTPFSYTFRLLEMSMNLSKLLNMYWFWTNLNMALCDYFFQSILFCFQCLRTNWMLFFTICVGTGPKQTLLENAFRDPNRVFPV